ncbi:MAG: hypothetical protein WHV28_06950, partial [Bacteroidota bacterium]
GITNAVRTDLTYNDPAWLTGLDWAKINGKPATFPPSAHQHDWADVNNTPTTVQGYGITNAVRTDLTYNDPAWLTGLDWAKIINAPAFTVTTDATLTGDGTTANPLGINLANDNLWTAQQSINANVPNGFALFVTNPNATGSAAYFNTDNPNYATVVIEQDDATGTALQVAGNTITDGTAIITNSDANFSGTLLSAQISNPNNGVAAIFSSNNINALDATVTIEQQGTGIALRTTGDVEVTGDVIATSFQGNLDWSYIQNEPTTFPPSAHTHDWADVNNTPTTVQGYGITNAVRTDLTYNDPSWLTGLDWSKIANAPAFITSVVTNSNNTLTGDGTTANPLGINLANQNTWTARQAINANVANDYAFFVTNPAANGSAAQFTVNSAAPAVVIENQGTGNSLEAVGNVYVEGNLAISNGTNSGTFQLGALTADRTYTLPNNSGTIALLSDIPAETDPVWNTDKTNYYTKTNMQTSGQAQLHFDNVTNKPTTLAGYGITDAQPLNTNLTSIAGLANAAGWLHNDGNGAFAYSTPTKADVGLGNVENVALSTWAGSTNITTLGTITTGTWNGSVIGDAYVTDALTIDGGTIENTPIGATTPAAATFTNLTATGTVTLPANSITDAMVVNDLTIATTDNKFTLQDNGDNTKQAQFELSGITAGATRTYTLPDNDGTIALLSDIPAAESDPVWVAAKTNTATTITPNWTFENNVTVGNAATDALTVNAASTFAADVTIGSATTDVNVQIQNDNSRPALSVTSTGATPAVEVNGAVEVSNGDINLGNASRLVASSNTLTTPFVSLTNTNATYNDFMLSVTSNGTGKAASFTTATGNAVTISNNSNTNYALVVENNTLGPGDPLAMQVKGRIDISAPKSQIYGVLTSGTPVAAIWIKNQSNIANQDDALMYIDNSASIHDDDAAYFASAAGRGITVTNESNTNPAILVNNNNLTSASTAIMVNQGRVLLSYTEDPTPDSGANFDLSTFGYASVIKLTATPGPGTVTALPAGAPGQILYIINSTGTTVTLPGSLGTIANGKMITLVSDGTAWYVQ